MKKQFIAKLLVLGLALAMLPTVAFAARRVETTNPPDNSWSWDASKNVYYKFVDDTNDNVGGGSTTPAPAPSTPAGEVEKTEVIDAIETIEADQVTVAEDGAVTVAIEATVKDGVASVELTDTAVESLAEQVKEGAAITLKVEAKDAGKVAVTLPAKTLTAVAEKTGADLTVESGVATITIPNAALATVFANAASVEVSAEISDNGVIAIAVLADSKAVTKDIKGLVVKF